MYKTALSIYKYDTQCTPIRVGKYIKQCTKFKTFILLQLQFKTTNNLIFYFKYFKINLLQLLSKVLISELK